MKLLSLAIYFQRGGAKHISDSIYNYREKSVTANKTAGRVHCPCECSVKFREGPERETEMFVAHPGSSITVQHASKPLFQTAQGPSIIFNNIFIII